MLITGINYTLLYIHIQNSSYKLEQCFTHFKNFWVVLTQLWVKYGQTQPLG